MYHFFVDPTQVTAHQAVILGTDVNHIRNVLRMKNGEEICINDGAHVYVCRICSVEADQIVTEILTTQEQDSELPVKITLFQGLPKSDKLEMIIQKCVELGVTEIVPVEMKRCIVKLDTKKEEAKRKRWQSISESAAKQAGRGIIPQILPVMRYDGALEYASKMDHMLLPYEHAGDMPATRRILESIRPGESIGIFIGPEGGFEDSEVEQARSCQAEVITLGRRILRTETAGMAILAMLGLVLEQ